MQAAPKFNRGADSQALAVGVGRDAGPAFESADKSTGFGKSGPMGNFLDAQTLFPQEVERGIATQLVLDLLEGGALAGKPSAQRLRMYFQGGGHVVQFRHIA